MSVVLNGTEADHFDHVFQFVRRRPFDQRLDIVLSELNYVRLQEAAKELFGPIRRPNFPRFEYNSLLSRATITTDPSDLNTLVRDHLSSLIRRATVSKLEEHGFSSKVLSGVQCHIDDEAASTRRYKGSRKIVDNGMHLGKGVVHTYQAVILVGIEENPVYHSPIVDEAVECIRPDYGQEVQLARKGFWQAVEETPLGPYMYEKFAWVGKVSNLFLEVYKRHGRSHRTEVTRHIIVEDGKYVELGILNLNLTVGELAPIAEVRRSDIGNTPIVIDAKYILSRLAWAMSWTGTQRFEMYCLHPERSA